MINFNHNDRVVPNGFRYSPSRDKHYAGTCFEMEQWEKNEEVLTIDVTGVIPDTVAAKDKKGVMANYHVSELRMATPEEIEKADEALLQVPKRGTLIKYNDVVYMVTSKEVDQDGDICISPVHEDHASRYLCVLGESAKNEEEIEVLGQIMPNGEFRKPDKKDDFSTWKKGDRVRYIGNYSPWWTNGRIYVISRDAHLPDNMEEYYITVEDDDGDLMNPRAARFERA